MSDVGLMQMFDQCLRSLAWEGRIVVIGFLSGDIPKVPANLLLVKNISVQGLYWGAYGTVRQNACLVFGVCSCMWCRGTFQC